MSLAIENAAISGLTFTILWPFDFKNRRLFLNNTFTIKHTVKQYVYREGFFIAYFISLRAKTRQKSENHVQAADKIQLLNLKVTPKKSAIKTTDEKYTVSQLQILWKGSKFYVNSARFFECT